MGEIHEHIGFDPVQRRAELILDWNIWCPFARNVREALAYRLAIYRKHDLYPLGLAQRAGHFDSHLPRRPGKTHLDSSVGLRHNFALWIEWMDCIDCMDCMDCRPNRPNNPYNPYNP